LLISACDGVVFLSTDLYMLRNFIAISFYFGWSYVASGLGRGRNVPL
jgi:hypothetical protein